MSLLLRHPRLSTLAIIALTIGGLGLLTFWLALDLRATVHQRILERDAQVLQPVLDRELRLAEEAYWLSEDPGFDLNGVLLGTTLATADLRGVFAVEVLDPLGEVIDQAPPDLDLPNRAGDLPPQGSSKTTLFEVAGARLETAPVLEVILPLVSPLSDLDLGYARYLIDGADVQAELAEVDQALLGQSLTFWLVASLLLGGFLTWASRRIYADQTALQDRAEALLRAHGELQVQQAGTALGTLSAHLAHGIRSPLVGLRACLQDGPLDAEMVAIALEQIDGISRQVEQTLETIRDAGSETSSRIHYSVTEFAELIRDRIDPIAGEASSRLEVKTSGSDTATVESYRAGVTLLILRNLASNAARHAERIRIAIEAKGSGLHLTLADNGPGLAPEIEEKLFQPKPRDLAEGAGLGLALSRQLALSIQANLQLQSTGPQGTHFLLHLPPPHEIPNPPASRPQPAPASSAGIPG